MRANTSKRRKGPPVLEMPLTAEQYRELNEWVDSHIGPGRFGPRKTAYGCIADVRVGLGKLRCWLLTIDQFNAMNRPTSRVKAMRSFRLKKEAR